MWYIWITAGMVVTVIIIINLWEKFQTNPTITGLDTNFHNWEVAFPAVTICQHAPTTDDKITDYILNHYQRNETTSVELDFFLKFTQLSLNTWKDFTDNYLTDDILDENANIKDLIFNITNKCENIFKICYWKSTAYNCCDIFYPVFTENGFCYTFNSKHYEGKSQKISSEDKFTKHFIQEIDLKWSLTFEVNNLTTFFSIYILNANELVSIDTKPQHIWDFRIETILFSVKHTYTTQDTAQLNLKQRRCAFQDDVKITIDDTYSYTACTTECRMKNAMKYCSCIPFFYPIDESSYRHCKINEFKCISKNLDKIKSVEKCNCHLGCLHTSYEIEKLNSILTDENELTRSLESRFVSWPMVRYKREVLFGWVDLLVSFGGIAGLFLGFSLLSAAEILYYFTIRMYCATREKSGNSPKKNQEMPKNREGFELAMPVFYQQRRLSYIIMPKESY